MNSKQINSNMPYSPYPDSPWPDLCCQWCDDDTGGRMCCPPCYLLYPPYNPYYPYFPPISFFKKYYPQFIR